MLTTKSINQYSSTNIVFLGDTNTGLRKRADNESSENMEKYYSNIQEKLADEMLSLTRNLKEQTLTANKILKRDTEVRIQINTKKH